ncbi:hypothetical protein WAK64_10795 [Bacillus spongiae]|uniref:Uncharacterized protein n=1 Tax=Bacillus spongiae TaxID=2683610 RepID=A0ABU8HE98_9BACI
MKKIVMMLVVILTVLSGVTGGEVSASSGETNTESQPGPYETPQESN